MYITIESMTQNHISDLVKLFEEIDWHKPRSLFEFYLQQQLNKTQYIWVAKYKNNLAGYITLNLSSKYLPFQEANIPEIMDLNVLPSFRNRGVASELLKVAEFEASKTSNIVGIGVGLSNEYGAAQRLYIKHKYIPDGKGITYNYKPVNYNDSVVLDDDLVLWLTKEF